MQFFRLVILLLGIMVAFTALSAGCQLRNSENGHRFIKAFYARTWFQRLLTFTQREKDIDVQDIGKITYLGYISAVIFTLCGALITPCYIYNVICGEFVSIVKISYICFCSSILWSGAVLLLQEIDSYLT